MKQKRYLVGALAIIFLVGVLWYGSILAWPSDDAVSIQTVSGDISALEGITLEGMLADGTHTNAFILQDGTVKSVFRPSEHRHTIYEVPSSYESSTFYLMPVIEPGTFPIQEIAESSYLTSWLLTTDRARMYIEYNSDAGSAVLDTGIVLQQEPDVFVFGGYPENDNSIVLWHEYDTDPSYALQDSVYAGSICRTVNGQAYATVNLPWGGFRLYRMTEILAGRTNRYERYEEKRKNAKPQTKEACLAASLEEETWGDAVLTIACNADQAGRILDLYQLGDKLIAITLSNADCDLAVLDKDGRLQKTSGPKKSGIDAYIFGADDTLEQVIPLMELPRGTEWNAEIFLCKTDAENVLCLDIDVTREYSTRYMQCGAVLKLVEDKVQLLEAVAYPYRDDPAIWKGSFTDEQLRSIVWVQTDETQSKMAVVWQSGLQWNPEGGTHTGGDLFLEIIQDGKLNGSVNLTTTGNRITVFLRAMPARSCRRSISENFILDRENGPSRIFRSSTV